MGRSTSNSGDNLALAGGGHGMMGGYKPGGDRDGSGSGRGYDDSPSTGHGAAAPDSPPMAPLPESLGASFPALTASMNLAAAKQVAKQMNAAAVKAADKDGAVAMTRQERCVCGAEKEG